MNGAIVPMARPRITGSPPLRAAPWGSGSVSAATGSMARVAAANWTAVTATGSRPGSSLVWATVNEADSTRDSSTSPSPDMVAPPWAPVPAISTTPASDTAYPAQTSGRAMARNRTAEMIATSTGVAPTSRAAWLTLVRRTPAFCRKIVPP